MDPVVAAVSRNPRHAPGKDVVDSIRLIAGIGVEGDAHSGETVQHRSRVVRDPSQPNLRQVHLIHLEHLEALAALGFPVGPGVMGENITTAGVDLLRLPTGTVLDVGAEAVVEVTGLRNPCLQLESIAPGLMAANLEVEPGWGGVAAEAADRVRRKAGVMAVVLRGGVVRAGDPIVVRPPPPPHRPLEPV